MGNEMLGRKEGRREGGRQAYLANGNWKLGLCLCLVLGSLLYKILFLACVGAVGISVSGLVLVETPSS